MKEANYRISILTRNFLFLLFFLLRVLRKILDIGATFWFSFFEFKKMPQSGKVHSTTPNHYSCLLGTVCGPGWNHKLSFWKGSNQRMPQLGFHSCQRLSLPLNAGSVSSESTYNDINYLKFPQLTVQLITHSATSPQTYTSRNNYSHSYLIPHFTQRNLSVSSTSLKFYLSVWADVMCLMKLLLLCLNHKKI